MPGPMVILETAARLLQSTQSPDGLNNSTLQGDANAGNSPGRDAYEFVAFLLWYLFLVVCCVLPTCCAYRRRRLMEARIAQQQASFDQLHQQNFFILSNLHLRPDLDGEEAKTIRTKRITDAVKATTFVSTAAQKRFVYDSCYVSPHATRRTVLVVCSLQSAPTRSKFASGTIHRVPTRTTCICIICCCAHFTCTCAMCRI
jgi:hypothetical protein